MQAAVLLRRQTPGRVFTSHNLLPSQGWSSTMCRFEMNMWHARHGVKATTFKAKDFTSKGKTKDLASKAKDMTSKANVKHWSYKAKDEATPRRCLVDITISTYIHSTNPINMKNKAQGSRPRTAKDTTFEAKKKAKDMTTCPCGASSPRPWPRGLHLCGIPILPRSSNLLTGITAREIWSWWKTFEEAGGRWMILADNRNSERLKLNTTMTMRIQIIGLTHSNFGPLTGKVKTSQYITPTASDCR